MAEIRVFVLPGGKLQVFVDGNGVSFEDAQTATLQVLGQLCAQGLDVQQTSEIEQHRDAGVHHVHVKGTTNVQH